MQDPAIRTYTVGLPVVVTILPWGRVTVQVDTSEIAAAITEDEGHDYPPSVIELDLALIQSLLDSGAL